MTTLKCSTCPYTADSDAAPDVCPECDGRLVARSVLRARELASEDAIDQLWLAYYAVREGDRRISERSAISEGAMFRRQAS